MSDKIADYARADAALPERSRFWPLYGAGFENLGRDGHLIDRPLPEPGPDELLVRHDAVGICFSDIKVIRSGQNHPRIYSNMTERPVVMGHEVALTVVKVGEALRDQYEVGDRFIVQADIYIGGKSYAYGYEIPGGYSEYNIVDQRVLNSDGGNYLIPVQPETGYAEAALNEPWACVEASYTVQYRTSWQEGGLLLIIGSGAGATLGAAQSWRPRAVALDVADAAFEAQIRAWAAAAGIPVAQDAPDVRYDDIVVAGGDAAALEAAFARLANGGVFAVVGSRRVDRPVSLDIGRMHYDHLALVGTEEGDIAAAYAPIRTQLRPGGAAWVLGAAGPMGHMHLQRALEMEGRPAKLVATNLTPPRMEATRAKFAPLAAEKGVELITLSQSTFGSEEGLLARLWEETGGRGFDDIAVNAPSVPTIEAAMPLLAPGGVMNVFAGVPRGTMARFPIELVTRRGARFTGTSGSSIDDLRHMLELTESHTLSTNSAVAAVASLEGVADGLRAVAEGRFPGKVVIYPNIKPLPLTSLEELAERLPAVYAKLQDGHIWTNEAEEELLREMLP